MRALRFNMSKSTDANGSDMRRPSRSFGHTDGPKPIVPAPKLESSTLEKALEPLPTSIPEVNDPNHPLSMLEKDPAFVEARRGLAADRIPSILQCGPSLPQFGSNSSPHRPGPPYCSPSTAAQPSAQASGVISLPSRTINGFHLRKAAELDEVREKVAQTSEASEPACERITRRRTELGVVVVAIYCHRIWEWIFGSGVETASRDSIMELMSHKKLERPLNISCQLYSHSPTHTLILSRPSSLKLHTHTNDT